TDSQHTSWFHCSFVFTTATWLMFCADSESLQELSQEDAQQATAISDETRPGTEASEKSKFVHGRPAVRFQVPGRRAVWADSVLVCHNKEVPSEEPALADGTESKPPASP